MECRQLTGKDALDYWELRVMGLKESPEAFATTWKEAISRKDPVEQTKQNLESDKSRSFGIFEDGKLTGSVTLVFEHYEKLRHKALIVAMYVSPLFRRKGAGTLLLKTAIKKAREKGIEQLLLSVVTTNEKAIALYKALGFITYGMEPKALKLKGQYWDEELMVLALK